MELSFVHWTSESIFPGVLIINEALAGRVTPNEVQ
jgi:hypothetical protein